ncbi:MAG: LysR family transcriptional regulator [Negativibacillus sp.]|nr:LysR family transcriptional regulator [Negativibacillus sp.]
MLTKLENYRVFCKVAQHKSFSGAAQELFLSQPAVSQSVRQMEEQLGMQLFVRSSKKVELTPQGSILYEYASSALGLLESAEQQLSGLQTLGAGQLRLGAGDITARHLLLPALERFHQLYPKVHLSIFNRTSASSLELLHAGRIDAAFVNLPIEDDRITVHWESPVQDIFVAGQRFAELKDKPLTARQLARLPLIMLEHKANSRVYVQRFFLRQGVELQPEIELASYELMGELARINLGVSCMVRQFCRQELQSGKLFELRLTEPVPARSIGMVSLKGVSLPPSVARFVELMNETTRTKEKEE